MSFQNSTLTFGPTSAYSTINRLEFELFDSEGLSNQYSILIKVANDFEYNPDTIEDVIVLYSNSAEIDISQLLYNSISKVEVVLHEGSKEVTWAKYIDNKTILISNFTQYDFGVHNLTVSIYDSCFMKTFESAVVVKLYPHSPPTAVGTIQNLTAYQGQQNIELKIDNDIFYRQRW